MDVGSFKWNKPDLMVSSEFLVPETLQEVSLVEEQILCTQFCGVRVWISNKGLYWLGEEAQLIISTPKRHIFGKRNATQVWCLFSLFPDSGEEGRRKKWKGKPSWTSTVCALSSRPAVHWQHFKVNVGLTWVKTLPNYCGKCPCSEN